MRARDGDPAVGGVMAQHTSHRGVVLGGTGGTWSIFTDGGETLAATLRGRVKHGVDEKLAVGDDVEVERSPRGDSWVISGILPRRSKLARRAPGGAHGERIVAANIDQVLVVFAAAQPEPHPRMLDRFLVIAAANDLPAHVVINKIDLAPDARARFAEYVKIGYALEFTSVKQKLGLESLRESLAMRVSALSGPSGVGKSSLLNALYPGLNLRVGEISHSVNKGRHTTVGALMHPLPRGGFVADTPGLREVGLWNLHADELDRCFLEFRPFLGQCRFGDCRHVREPECAVRAAVQKFEVTEARYESYRKLYSELS